MTLLAVGHGTRDPAGVAAVRALLDRVRALRPALTVVESYAELTAPSLEDALATVTDTEPVVAVPLMLGRGYHALVDIPTRIGSRAAVARPLGPHALLAQALADRLLYPCATDAVVPGTADPAAAAVRLLTPRTDAALPGAADRTTADGTVTADPPVTAGRRRQARETDTGMPGTAGQLRRVPEADTGMPGAAGRFGRAFLADAVVLGAAGTSDPAGVADVRVAARLLGWRLGRPVAYGFAASAWPALPDVVRALRRGGARRVAVASYLLAPGHFQRRVAEAGADVVSPPLGAHDALARLVLRRYDEALGSLDDAGAEGGDGQLDAVGGRQLVEQA
jgi:sirohydrochlorin ferrochelatase